MRIRFSHAGNTTRQMILAAAGMISDVVDAASLGQSYNPPERIRVDRSLLEGRHFLPLNSSRVERTCRYWRPSNWPTSSTGWFTESVPACILFTYRLKMAKA